LAWTGSQGWREYRHALASARALMSATILGTLCINQRVQYNKTRENVEIYTTTASKLPHQKGG